MNTREIVRLVVSILALAVLLTFIITCIMFAVKIANIVLSKPVVSETLYRVLPFNSDTMYVCLGELTFANKEVICRERDGESFRFAHDAAVFVEVVQ